MLSSYNKQILKDVILSILETAHDANIGRGYGRSGGYDSTNQTLGGLRTMGASIFPYLEKQTEIEEEEYEIVDDDIIMAISSKTDSFRPNFDPNNQRKDNRTLGSTPLGEARWGGLVTSQLPQKSLGMVTPASRALNSPPGNKGTAMGGQNTRTHDQRKTGSRSGEIKISTVDEPVYDFSDILGNASDGRGNIDKIKKLTWILQNSDE
jgi:hypothetical protein